MRTFHFPVLLALFISITATVTAQQAGMLDPLFNGSGYNRIDFLGNTDVANDLAMQPDQKIVAAGVAFTPAWNVELRVVRLNDDGSLDATFGNQGAVGYAPSGMSYYEAHAQAVAIQPDGKIVVAGAATNNNGLLQVLIIRLNSDGSFDLSFGNNGICIAPISGGNSIAEDVALDAAGNIVVAGSAYNDMFNITPMLARFLPDGTPDATFGNDGSVLMDVEAIDNEFTSICLQPDGKILASGHYEATGGIYNTLLARFMPDGLLDPSFGNSGMALANINGVTDEFFGMALNSQGEIIVGGYTNHNYDRYNMLLMKYNQNGVPEPSFGNLGIVEFGQNAYNVVYDLKIQPDDKILVAGASGEFAPGDNDWILARFDKDGTVDASFGTDGYTLTQFFGEQDEMQAIEIDGNDKIYACGKTLNTSQGIRDFTIARFTNNLHVGLENNSMAKVDVVSVTNGVYEFHCPANFTQVEVINSTGAVAGAFSSSGPVCRVDMRGCPPGVYFYRLVDSDTFIGSGKLGIIL